MELNKITEIIIGCAIEVHRSLGPGLLESVYEECLYYELKKTGLHIQKQKPMPIIYKEVRLEYGYRMDLVVIEIKAVEGFTNVHLAQILTYIKLGNYKLGLLLNFNVTTLKAGIKRVMN